jgi:hypothetical protein
MRERRGQCYQTPHARGDAMHYNTTRPISSVCMVYIAVLSPACCEAALVTSPAKADASFTYMSWKGRSAARAVQDSA